MTTSTDPLLAEIDRMIENHDEYNSPYSAEDVATLLTDIRKLIVADRERIIEKLENNRIKALVIPHSRRRKALDTAMIEIGKAIRIVKGEGEKQEEA